jgi:hypothetical protein
MSSTLQAFLSGTVITERKPPVAMAVADPAFGVVGSVVRLNGQHSYDPSELPGRSGNDSVTIGLSNIISSASGGFTTSDLGRVIDLVGADAGAYEIVGIVSSTQIQVSKADGGTAAFVGGNSSWSINDKLTFTWAYTKIPVGSNVNQEGFRLLDPDGSLASFSPDIVGEYIIQLTVANPAFTSIPATVRVSVRAILVPHAQGIVPDGKFIWQYLRDVWQHVEGKEFFETFWSALIQIVGGEMLKLYQNDFNKSIRDIQDLYQRRWLSYEPELALDGSSLSFYLGNNLAGIGATTRNIGVDGQLIILSPSEFIVVEGTVLDDVTGDELNVIYDSKQPLNVHAYTLQGTNASKNGYRLAPPTAAQPAPDPALDRIKTGVTFQFSFQSTTWTLFSRPQIDYAEAMSESGAVIDQLLPIYAGIEPSPLSVIQAGDVIHYPTGPNAGFYRIVSKFGASLKVDKAPPGASDLTPATIYRPVTFRMNIGVMPISDSFAVPSASGAGISDLASGRVIVVGNQTFTLSRSVVDPRQSQEMVIVTTDGGEVLTSLDGLPWRVPSTLVSTSQNFEDLGVSLGDLLTLEVTNLNNGALFEFPAQVVGVDRYRLGFVPTDEALQDGVVSVIPPATVVAMASQFGISGASIDVTGALELTGDMAKINSTIQTGLFQKQYFNQALDPSTQINIQGGLFKILPKTIRRNRRLPVDPKVISIPVLQDWIIQPTIVEDGGVLYQVRHEKRFVIPNRPYSLIENSDFVVDGELAVEDTYVFDTGSKVVNIEDGRFLERDLQAGDTFEVLSPEGLVGVYIIQSIVSAQELVLATPLPDVGRVGVKLQIKRRKGGTFIHFTPGGFTAKKPAPKRFWAEVSFFDNSQAIENNFGLLVDLKRSDLEAISSNLNYRQAVAGLMFAYTNGPAIDKMRLGAQILLGLPFAEHVGIIRSVEDDYRLDSSGAIVQGRILIEDTDNSGNPMGIMRVYTFPVDPVSDLAGIDVNPATGKLYSVGDTVKLFAALSKGVEVDDYQTKPLTENDSAISWIQQFNSFRLRANDSIFTLDELSLLSTFLKNISPSYVAMIISSTAEFADTVTVRDAVGSMLHSGDGSLVDTAYFSSPAPDMFDAKTLYGRSMMISDVGFFQIRLFMGDLRTDLGSFTVTLPVDIPTGEGLLIRIGDFIRILSGLNAGLYPVTDVAGRIVTLGNLPASGLQNTTQDALILRQVVADLRSGSYTSSANAATVLPGSKEDYVGPGDLFLTNHGDSIPVVSVGAAGVLTLLSAPSSTSGSYHIIRKAFLEAPFQHSWAQGLLTRRGTSSRRFWRWGMKSR